MEIDYAAVGARICNFRKARGLSQAKLAEMAGISIGHMCQIESGNTGFSLSLLMRLSGILETTPGQILAPDHAGQKTRRQEILEQLSKELASCTQTELSLMKKVVHDLQTVLNECENIQKQERKGKQGKDNEE